MKKPSFDLGARRGRISSLVAAAAAVTLLPTLAFSGSAAIDSGIFSVKAQDPHNEAISSVVGMNPEKDGAVTPEPTPDTEPEPTVPPKPEPSGIFSFTIADGCTVGSMDFTGVGENATLTAPSGAKTDLVEGVNATPEPGRYTAKGQFTGLNPVGYANKPASNLSCLQSVDSWEDTGTQRATFSTAPLLVAMDEPPLTLTDKSYFFYGATAFDQDISSWDMSTTKTTAFMFANASKFNQDISGWTMTSVTNMQRMFGGAYLFNKPLNGWDVSNVTTMAELFMGASYFNQPLDSWKTDSLTDLTNTFASATRFNQNINSWNVANVTNLTGVFSNAKAFNQPLSNWKTGNVLWAGSAFTGASAFNQNINSWDMGKNRVFSRMFEKAIKFDQPLNNWNVVSMEQGTYMFNDARAFFQDISMWKTCYIKSEPLWFSNSSPISGTKKLPVWGACS